MRRRPYGHKNAECMTYEVRLRVERRHHLQSVCLQDVVLVQSLGAKSGWSVLQHPPYSPDLASSDFHLTMTMFNTNSLM
ncbi:hypothetical protein AVEN_40346-1 [Araneus ventricosus]|uniref:Histone-lysine N-methyltransferase SETMAR n=1 Tax=Araneus ventricosus TaxID=182803 RepID=A0A4Y2F176_ARAVE|nr:hypothetical protein AVEN_40346-1 [Araneus ventricosus]